MGWIFSAEICNGAYGRYLAKIFMPNLARKFEGCFSSLSGIGYIKGKSAIYVVQTFGSRERNFRGENFWARGYYVSTVGKDEELVKAYIQGQEDEDKKRDQLQLWS
jgi:hypothetical protein